MGGLIGILNKVITVEMKPHQDRWVEYVGKLTFCFENKMYYLEEYVKYLCRRDRSSTKKVAIESGDLVVLDSFNIATVKVNPKPMKEGKMK